MNFQEAIRRTLDYLRNRQLAYRLTFRTEQPANMEVLRDLAHFCRANETAALPGDHDRTWALVGRREVWLRITQHLHLTPEQLFELYSNRAAPTGERRQQDE